jgi:hypothetical protein
MEVVVTGHNFESILPKDHPCHVRFKLADWFQKRRLLNNFPIGSYVKTMSAKMATMSRHSFNIAMAVWDLNSNLDVFSMQTFLRGLIYVR